MLRKHHNAANLLSVMMNQVSLLKRRRKLLAYLIVICLGLIWLIVYLEQVRKTNIILTALGSRNVADHLRLYEETTILDATKGCQFHGKNLDATVLVTTMASSKSRREAIRKTWANWKYDDNVMVFFFAGRPEPSEMEEIKKESQLHGDLIVEDVEESYHSLTVKTLRMLKWFLDHCPKSKFLIKTDDDVFIHLPNMLKYLRTEAIPHADLYENYIGGLVHLDRSPHTWNPFSKWYVPSQLLPPGSNSGGNFPAYVGGPCYVMSSPIVSKLYKYALSVPLINLEDVYLTGIVATETLKIKLQEIPFVYDAHYPRINHYLSGKDYVKSCTAYHTDGDVSLMYELYDEILSQ